MFEASPSSAPGAPAPRSPRACASAASPWATTASSPALRARPRDRRGRALDRAGPVGRARLRRDAARRARPAHAPLLGAPAADVDARRAGRSSSTAPGARSPPRPTRRATRARSGSRRRSACARSSSPTTAARSTTPARRSRRTTSSRSTAPPPQLFDDAGAPPEALVPLMGRTIENGFELTGPIARGDWETVERHRAALRRQPARAALRRHSWRRRAP